MEIIWIIGLVLFILLVCVIYIVLKLRSLEIRPLTQDDIKSAVVSSVSDLKLMEAVGGVKEIGEEMRNSYQAFERLLEVKRGRAEFGEYQLEELLGEALPKDRFGIREEVKGVGIPDAHIKSVQGIICIDSKFPLDNYRKMISTDVESERQECKRRFREDVKNRVEEVKKYIKPEEGTTSFALAFIPSEAVFYYLASEELSLVTKAASQNVILVSPIRLYLALNFVREGIWGERLTKKAKEIRDKLQTLDSKFEEFDTVWSVLKDTHLKRAYDKADEVDRKYKELKEAYERIKSEKIEEEESPLD